MKNKPLKEKTLKFSSPLTVISFSPGCIKLIQVNCKIKPTITKIYSKDNIGDSQYEILSALESIIKNNHLKIGPLVICLDRSLITVRYVKLPTENEKELSEMVKWQAAKLLPYKVDEMVVSYEKIDTDSQGFTNALLVIAPRNSVKKFTDICQALKLNIDIVGLSSEGLLKWLIDVKKMPASDGAICLVDIDKDKAELIVASGGKFIFSRSFSLKNKSSDDEFKSELIRESGLSVDSYLKQERSKPLMKILLTGNNKHIDGLSSMFKERFNLPVDILDNFDTEILDKKVILDNTQTEMSFASMCGLALAGKNTEINLIPDDVKEKQFYQKRKKEFFQTLRLFLIGGFILSVLFYVDYKSKMDSLNKLNKELNDINPVASQIQDIKDRMKIVNLQMDNKDSCIDVLREIYKITPQEIYLNTFVFEENKDAILRGNAPTMSTVFSFVNTLNESKFFKNIEVKYVNQRKTKAQDITDFEIICTLEKASNP